MGWDEGSEQATSLPQPTPFQVIAQAQHCFEIYSSLGKDIWGQDVYVTLLVGRAIHHH